MCMSWRKAVGPGVRCTGQRTWSVVMLRYESSTICPQNSLFSPTEFHCIDKSEFKIGRLSSWLMCLGGLIVVAKNNSVLLAFCSVSTSCLGDLKIQMSCCSFCLEESCRGWEPVHCVMLLLGLQSLCICGTSSACVIGGVAMTKIKEKDANWKNGPRLPVWTALSFFSPLTTF